MTTFAVSFNIHYDSAASYQRRYDSFMSEIRKCRKVWSETTSFCLCDTDETIDAFQHRLYMSLFSPTIDKMLVIDVQYDAAVARGNIEYPYTLRELLPGVEIK